MSWKAVKWAYEQRGMSAPQKSVLVALAFHFNEKEHCAWPSWPKLAEETDMERTTIWRATRALEKELGLILIEERRDGGRQTSNRYYLPDFDALSRPGPSDVGAAA